MALLPAAAFSCRRALSSHNGSSCLPAALMEAVAAVVTPAVVATEAVAVTLVVEATAAVEAMAAEVAMAGNLLAVSEAQATLVQ